MPQSKLDILVKNQLTLTEENLDKQGKKGSAREATEKHLNQALHCYTYRNPGTEHLAAHEEGDVPPLPGQLPSPAQMHARECPGGLQTSVTLVMPSAPEGHSNGFAEEASNGETEPCTAPTEAETLFLCPASTS